MMPSLRHSRLSPRRRIRPYSIIWTLSIVLTAFYAGLLVGMRSNPHHSARCSGNDFEQAVKKKVQALLQKRLQIDQENLHHNIDFTQSRFGQATSHFAIGAARIDKQDFVEAFDSGFPPDQGNADPEASQVLIFYNGHKALPNLKREETLSASGLPPKLTALDVTQNCQTLHVVSTKSALQQCVALVPQYESFHVDRWMRIEQNSKLNNELPLVQVGRGQQSNGVNQFETPSQRATKVHQQHLQTYLENASSALERLRPLLKKVAIDNTIVVIIGNRGHTDLLANFVCANRARGLSLEGIVVFCTDQETCDIATALGMTAYYDNKIFGEVSSSEAKEYGDKVFQQLMYAKVIAAHLVISLGYNMLFQDVDVVWYKNPLEFLQSSFLDADMLFQEDGARSARYAPYSANSGFYFVRYNEQTRHLMTRMLYSGDTIVTSGSHQQALNSLLAEHASLYGLRVKVLPGHDFPGGFHFHRDKEFMRGLLVRRTRQPFLFHMSWTRNKEDKLKFLEQMGLWYVKDNNSPLRLDSCVKEPVVVCHFKDKPSVEPCRDSPSIDKNGKSFWP